MNTKSLFAIGVLALSVTALADTDTTETASPESMSPKDVCQRLTQIDMSKKNARAQAEKWMVGSEKSEAAGKMAKPGVQAEINSADCKSETIAGNHAFVVAQSSDNKERLLPFIKQGNMWKLDVQAYHSLYRMDSRMPASK